MLVFLLLSLYDVPAPASADTTQARWLADLDPTTVKTNDSVRRQRFPHPLPRRFL